MNKRYVTSIFIICVFGLLPLMHLLFPGLPVTHDGKDHVARIANFYQSFVEGNIVPRWANNLNWGFGHPVLMFLYPLPSYTAVLFKLIGFSFVDTTKIVFALAYLLSGITMYIWTKRRWGEYPALLSALLYLYAPYRFVDLVLRGAIGEHTAFIFLPLLLLSADILKEKKSRIAGIILFSLSLCGLLLSHNAVSIMMIPVVLMYVVYIVLFESTQKIQFVLSVLLSAVLGGMLSSFFLLPAFFEGKYTLRDIVTQGEAITRTVQWRSFFFSPWNYGGGQEFTKQIGIIHWIFIAFSFFSFKKLTQKNQRIFLAGSLILFILYLWIMTSQSATLWNSVSIIQKFQFPWRFLTMTTFIAAILGGFSLVHLKVRLQKILFLLAGLFLLLTTNSMWIPSSYTVYHDDFFTNVYEGTTDTGESSPIWSVRFMEYKPQSHIEVVSGSAQVVEQKRNTTYRSYIVDAAEQSMLVENTLYFPGWNIYINGEKTSIEFQNPNWRGRMLFTVPAGRHIVEVRFTETKLRVAANTISGIGVGVLIVLCLANLLKKKKNI